MKKISLILVIFSLILSTAIIKNSAKKTEDKIFTVKENLRVLNSEFEKIKLEYDYLSSAEKLLEYQSLYFEDDLVQKNIENIKIFKTTNKDNTRFKDNKRIMEKSKSKIVIEDYKNNFDYKKNETNLNIQFNRVAFIFFLFFIIYLIYTIHLIHLGFSKSKIEIMIIFLHLK